MRSGFYARGRQLSWSEAEAAQPECSAAWDVYWRNLPTPTEFQLLFCMVSPYALGYRFAARERDVLLAVTPEPVIYWPPLPFWYFANGLWHVYAGAN